MAVQCDGGGKDELKTQFMTREGVYKLMTLSEYSRPNRVGFNAQGNTPVKVSFVTVPDPSGNGDRICFNVGRELYVYVYKGVKKVRMCADHLIFRKSGLLFMLVSVFYVHLLQSNDYFLSFIAISLTCYVLLYIYLCIAKTAYLYLI